MEINHNNYNPKKQFTIFWSNPNYKFNSSYKKLLFSKRDKLGHSKYKVW